MTIEKKITQNLFDLYRLAGSFESAKYRGIDSVEFVWNEPNPWPNFIFGNQPNAFEKADHLNRLIGEKAAPPFIICTALSQKLHQKFQSFGIRKIMEWPGMYLNPNQISHTDHSQKLKTRVLTKEQDVESWNKIVATNLFNHKAFSSGFLEHLLKHDEIKLLGGFYNGKMVSTAMSFTRNAVGGLFMISTLPDYRNSGFGKDLTRAAVDLLVADEAELIVLEANQSSYKLYQSLGFKESCKFEIYWKIGYE